MALRHWKFHLGQLILLAFILAVLGWLTGKPAWVIAIGLGAYLCWHLYNLWLLHRWLRMPDGEVPDARGIWHDIFDGISDLERKTSSQQKEFRKMIGEFRSLTDAFPDATLVIDEHGLMTWFNNAAVELLGLKSPGDLGQPVTNLLRHSDFVQWLAVQGEINTTLEMPSPRDDRVWLQISAVIFRENQRLIILRDITSVHNVEKIRRDFVANISHELRTPLTVLQGYLEILEKRPNLDVSNAVGRMLSQTAQIQSLLDDLLELSRLQESEVVAEENTVNVPATLAQIHEQAIELSKDRHKLIFDVDDSLHLAGIESDLKSAFSNLVNNAVKYTPEGGKVKVTWANSKNGAVLSVKDSGIGIPKKDIPRLTERFYRVGSDRARQSGGSGLGLAIVKHVLNSHDAELTITSELGQGSAFTCRFDPERTRIVEAVTKAS